jgi:adenylate kinase
MNVKDFYGFLLEREIPDKQGKIITIMGPPGSGKGTVSKRLQNDYDFQHVSTGEMIRNSSDESIKKKSDSGKFVTDSEMADLLKERFGKLDMSKNIILDGFPRTLKQAKMLDKVLGELGLGLNHAIYLDVDKDIALKRIAKRAEKENRKDDKDPAVVEKRFQDYEVKTVPVIDQYRKSRKLIEIKDLGNSGKITSILLKKMKISSEIPKKEKEEPKNETGDKNSNEKS